MSAIVYDCSWFFTLLPNMFFCWAQGRKCEGKNHREREVVTKLRFAPVSPLPKVLPLAHVSLCETAQFAPQTCAPSFLTFSPLSARLLLVWNQRGNLKRGERISETKLSALSPLLWFPLRIAPLRRARSPIGSGQCPPAVTKYRPAAYHMPRAVPRRARKARRSRTRQSARRTAADRRGDALRCPD